MIINLDRRFLGRRPSALGDFAVGFIGDSITGGAGASDSAHYAATVCGATLATWDRPRTVTVVNQGIAGTVSHDWIPSFGTKYSDAVTAFAAASPPVTIVHVMLGTNDAKAAPGTATFYSTNLGDMVSSLVSAGYKVVVSYPPWLVYSVANVSYPGAWNTDSPAEIALYQPKIDALVDGVHVFQGDTQAYDYFQANPSLLADGVHPDDAGHAWLGGQWAAAIALALGL